MNNKKIMLLFGGESSEHEVSLVSARNIYRAIDKQKYQIYLIFIDKSGVWWSLSEFDDYQNPIHEINLHPGTSDFSVNDGSVITPDVLFPVLHGKNGEDGSVQGLAQLLHLPIVGCDMTGSVIAMDKISTKEILAYRGFRVLPFLSHEKDGYLPSYSEATTQLGSALFIKPSRAGSSMGVTMVQNESDYKMAVGEALKHDDSILIEQAASKPRELEVAVLGLPPHHQASVVGEVRPEGDFYSYDSKYSDESSSEVIIPANVEVSASEDIRQQALDIYRTLRCRGMARVDFLLDDSGLYINEVNTIPGFTNISMYPKLWEASGLSYSNLIDKLIELAR